MKYTPTIQRCLALLTAALLFLSGCGQAVGKDEMKTATIFAMDTLIDQKAYGPGAEKAIQEVNAAIADWDAAMTRFGTTSDIARINAAAGKGGQEVAPETADFLREALDISGQSQGVFALSIAPLTQAWGITTDAPRVPPQEEIQQLLTLVDDSAISIEGNRVTLAQEGMGLDLGGIAKGATCDIARDIYQKNNVSGALLSIGGNIYAHGTKPDGSKFRIGFNDPYREDSQYIASFEMQDQVIAMSGGYERFFEKDGKRYIHIIDPRTGFPAESDIVSVGAICDSGAEADFWSTTLFLWGRDKTLEHMKQGGCAVMLDQQGNLYISQALEESFELSVPKDEYNLIFVKAEV